MGKSLLFAAGLLNFAQNFRIKQSFYSHVLISNKTPISISKWLKKSKLVLTDLVGLDV